MKKNKKSETFTFIECLYRYGSNKHKKGLVNNPCKVYSYPVGYEFPNPAEQEPGQYYMVLTEDMGYRPIHEGRIDFHKGNPDISDIRSIGTIEKAAPAPKKAAPKKAAPKKAAPKKAAPKKAAPKTSKKDWRTAFENAVKPSLGSKIQQEMELGQKASIMDASQALEEGLS